MTEPAGSPPVRAAHILLDVVSVFDWSKAEDDSNAEAMSLALARLNEPGLITIASRQDNNDVHIDVDASAVVAAAVLLLHDLIDGLVEASGAGTTSHDVIVKLRERLDGMGEDDPR